MHNSAYLSTQFGAVIDACGGLVDAAAILEEAGLPGKKSSIANWCDKSTPQTAPIAVVLVLERASGCTDATDAIIRIREHPTEEEGNDCPVAMCGDVFEKVGYVHKECRIAVAPNSSGGKVVTWRERLAILRTIRPVKATLAMMERRLASGIKTNKARAA